MPAHLVTRAGIALVGAIVFLAGAHPSPAHAMQLGTEIGEIRVRQSFRAHSPEPLRVTVEVSYKGLDHQPDLEIEAALGQPVEITFVWADTAVPDNSHRLLLKGYGLRTGLLDSEHRQETLTFVPDKVGTFELVCDWRCEGHAEALQTARFMVSNPHDAGQVARTPTSLVLAPAAGSDAAGGGDPAVRLSATLTGRDGRAVSDAPVRFYLQTLFAGVSGEAEVATSSTDDTGTAVASYRPTTLGKHVFVARFAGSDLLAASEEALPVVVRSAAPAYVVAPRGLGPVAERAPLVVAAIVASIWTTFAFVLLQVVGLRRDGVRGATAPGVPQDTMQGKEGSK